MTFVEASGPTLNLVRVECSRCGLRVSREVSDRHWIANANYIVEDLAWMLYRGAGIKPGTWDDWIARESA